MGEALNLDKNLSVHKRSFIHKPYLWIFIDLSTGKYLMLFFGFSRAWCALLAQCVWGKWSPVLLGKFDDDCPAGAARRWSNLVQ